MYTTIDWHSENGIGFLELNTPPANIMNKLFFYEIYDLTDCILNKDEIKAIIVSGKGRHFSAGADIGDLLSYSSEGKERLKDFYIANSQTFKRFYTAKIPLIAAIKGVCIGSAMELALSCHFRFAAENIMMGFPEAGFNLMTGCGGSVYLSKFLDKKGSMELMLQGKNLNAAEAEEMGLVDVVVNKTELKEKAVNFATEICQNYDPKLKSFYIHKFLKQNNVRKQG